MIPKLTLTMKRAMLAAHATPMTLLMRRGKGFATDFIGGTVIEYKTVEALITRGLMGHPHNSKSVVLTDHGRIVAAALEAERAALLAVPRNHGSLRRMKQTMKRQMIARHEANAAQQRREWRRDANAITADDLTPLTTRLPYAD